MRRASRTSWVTNQTFYALLGTGVLALLGLLALAVRVLSINPAIYIWEVSTPSGSPQHWLIASYPFGIRILAALLGACLVSGVIVFLRQWLATRRLLGEIGPRRRQQSRNLQKVAVALELGDRLEVVEDSRLYSFCYGFVKPRICVSQALVDALKLEELRAVLLHERFHLRNRDPLKILLSRTVAETLFLLPLASNLRERYIQAKELAADDATVDHMGTEVPLAAALLKILSQRERAVAVDMAAIGALSVTEARIQRLLDPRVECLPPISVPRFFASAVMFSMLFILTILPAYAEPSLRPAGPSCHSTCPCTSTPLTTHGPQAR